MKIILIRHGKSDKSLENKLSHDEFEFQRPLIDGEEEKARLLGVELKKEINYSSGVDLVHSGKVRSNQTVLAIAKGLGLSTDQLNKYLREDFGLTYLADKEYWNTCEEWMKNGKVNSNADFFLANPPEEFFQQRGLTDHGQTFSAEYMRQNMRSVLRRAIERNIFLGNETVIMVSHEPVLSLCMSDLTGQSVNQLGGQFSELEYATFIIDSANTTNWDIQLNFRESSYMIGSKLLE